MFAYQNNGRFFAQIADGTSEVAGDELIELGAKDVKPGYRGLYFSADTDSLYRITYAARVPTRVFAPLLTFDCHSAKYLYRRVQSIFWPDIFTLDDTFAVFANVSNSIVRHSQYAALQVKDAIVDQFRGQGGRRPDVSTENPGVRINLYMHSNKATLSLETSAGSMHRRGYRAASVEAPMQEHVAAAIIRMTGWQGETPLYDPMCGSGTLLAEALMHYCRVPAGLLREGFGLSFLPDFDPERWRRVRADLEGAVRELPAGLVAGSDADGGAVHAARTNLARLPGGKSVRVTRRRFEDIEALAGTTIVCNPPYGMRIGKKDQMPAFVARFGDFLKQRCTGSTAYIYFGKRELLKNVGLRTTWKRPLANGGLDGRLARFELYRASGPGNS